MEETYCTDHWRCRFVSVSSAINQKIPKYGTISHEQIIALLSKLNSKGYEVIKTENLYEFDGKRGFSLGQGRISINDKYTLLKTEFCSSRRNRNSSRRSSQQKDRWGIDCSRVW